MSVISTVVYNYNYSDVVKHEYEPAIAFCRERLIANEGSALAYTVGTVVGIVTATGKVKRQEASAVDGSQVAAGGFAMPDWLKGAVGTSEQPGWGGMAMGAASGLMSAFMGMKQYGLAKQSLAQNKQQFETNFNAQKGLTNSSLEDRQRARVASNANAYESVGSYMQKNGVK